jgi:uroporphyrinogen decarboxylase
MEENNNDIFIVPGTGALLEMVWEGFGMENFSRLLARPKHVKKVFDDRGKFALELVKLCIEWGAELILLWDDYAYKSGLFMSPRSFELYIFPWLSRICNYVHKSGRKIMLHSCGDILKIFEELITCGIDAFNPIEPTTANPDYSIFKLKEKYGDKITLIGNVSPQDLAEKDADYIVDYSKKLIKKCGVGGGFIFSSGHSINPAVKLENFLAMRETLLKYGTYPISNST